MSTLIDVFSLYELLWRSTKQVRVQIVQVPGMLKEALLRGLKLHISLLVPPVQKV